MSPLWSDIDQVDRDIDSQQRKRLPAGRRIANYTPIRECLVCKARSLPYIGFMAPCSQDGGGHGRTVAVLEESETVAANLYAIIWRKALPAEDEKKLINWLKHSNDVIARRMKGFLQGLI